MGSGEWNLYHRKEFTKRIAANGEEITFVNLPVSLIVNLFVKFTKRFIPYLLGKYKINKDIGFYLYTPLMLSHYLFWRKSPIIGNIDGWFLSYQINRFVKKYYPGRKIRFWVYMPEQKYLLNKVKYDILVYDSYDDCDLNFDGTVNAKRAKLNEHLIKASDFVIVISKYTYQKYSRYAKNIIRSRGGYSPDIFIRNTNIENIPDYDKPVIGYIGTFRDWIDYSLIDKLIETKSFKLMFIGYIDRSSKNYFSEMIKNKDVVHIDYVEISQIPKIMKSFSAGIIPFKINDFMRSVYPNKFFEYVSFGVPVVTTSLPELEVFKDYIGYSRDNDEFVDNCRKATAGGFANKVASYNEITKNNDWDSIVKEILQDIRKIKTD